MMERLVDAYEVRGQLGVLLVNSSLELVLLLSC